TKGPAAYGRALAEAAYWSTRRRELLGDDRDGGLVQGALDAELDLAVSQRVQRVVLAHADVYAGVEARAALAHDDAARQDGLAAVHLDAKALRFGVAAVPGGTAALFLCHV